jgi:acyl-CoA synthetase (AMP-forming)/AMP-acid ligase II/thioesterase domain-containing protein
MRFGRAIAGFAARHPDKIAIVSTTQGQLTYGELARQIETIGEELRAAGLNQLSRVGVLLDHGMEAALTEIGVADACIAVPLDPNYSERDLLAASGMYDIDALVVGPGDETRGAKVAAARDIPLLQVSEALAPTPHVTLSVLSPGGAPRPGRPEDEDFAFLMRSSGTTGKPKIIPVTHGNILALPINMVRIFEVTPEDRSVCNVPLYYSVGLTQCLLSPLMMGGSASIPHKSAREDVQDWLATMQPTWMSTSPPTLRRILDKLSPDQHPALPGIKFVICSASLVPEPLRKEAEDRLGVPVLEVLGSTESGVLTSNPRPPKLRKPHTVGPTVPELVAVLGPDGERLGPGEVGDVGIRGPNVTPGYLGMPKPADGWLRIGDLGMLDEDGYLTIVGRAKEMINRGGTKISPYDVEAVAMEHPAIAECAAFGAPHPRLGEAVALAVVFKPGLRAAPAELKSFMAERVTANRVPQSVVALEALPRGPTGKIVRERLTAAFVPDDDDRIVVAPYDMLQTQIVGVWRRLLGRDDIGIDDDFFEIGGDSLLGQEMLVEVEGIAGRKIPEGDIPYPVTVRGLHRVVTAGIHTAAAPPTRVTEAVGGEGDPIFYCHGDYLTRGLYARRLGDLLKLERPVRLVHAGFDPDRVRTLEAIAAEIVPEILAAQPAGPITLAGYCNGALLSWELAHQLREAGREVKKLVIIEPISFNARRKFRALNALWSALGEQVRARQMVRHWRFTVWKPGSQVMTRLVLNKLSPRHFPLAPPAPTGRSPYEDRMTDLVFDTMAQYAPPRLDVPVHCLSAVEGEDRDQYAPRFWQSLSRSLEITPIKGAHLSCVTVYLVELADTLRPILG